MYAVLLCVCFVINMFLGANVSKVFINRHTYFTLNSYTEFKVTVILNIAFLT